MQFSAGRESGWVATRGAGFMDEGHWSDSTEREIAKGFDLKALPAAYLDDPYPYYHALRRHDPVHRLPDGSYLLTRYSDVAAVYRDSRMSSDKRREFKPTMGDGPLYLHHTTSLVFNDPPLHTRVRKLLAPAFTPRALASLRPSIERVVERMLDRFQEQGRMDVIADFAAAIPVQLICDMLGIDEEDRGPLRQWSLDILSGLEPVVDRSRLDRGNRAVADFSAFLARLIEARRRAPRDDDVLTALISGEVDGQHLSDDELQQNCIFLLNAGHETTTNLIGNAVDALLRFPEPR